MASSAGPKVQLPGATADWFWDSQGKPCSITIDAMQFFHIVQQIAVLSTQSGSTSARPINSLAGGLWVGLPFFDQSLGKPVWLKSLTGTTTQVWVDATGAPV
jgi:hypothetical protein